MEKNIKYSSRKRKHSIGFYIATAIVIFGVVTMVFPYLWMFLTSFKTTTEAWADPPTLIPTK